MSNPNNLIRPPVAPANASQNAQMNMDELTAIISNIVTNIFRQQGPQIVQAALSPNANIQNASDQQIEDRHRNNLNDMDKIPDVVKCLKEFTGQPGEYNSWKKSVDRILEIYEPLRGTPKYYGILSIIRNKIMGNADIALESYNTPLNWQAISQCLTAHYGDKRDLSTLEYQMTTLVQGNQTIQDFYQRVYTHLSLILSKIGCLEMGNESLKLITKSYREKALDTFIRGLNGDLPRLLGIREPVDLPQALHLCLKLQNQNFRTNHANNAKRIAPLQLPPGRNFEKSGRQNFYPHLAYMPQTRQPIWQPKQQLNSQNPFRPPKPQPRPEPMDVDQSMHSRHINYINRPYRNDLHGKRPGSISYPQQKKSQRTFHIHAEQGKPDTDNREYIEPTDIHFLV